MGSNSDKGLVATGASLSGQIMLSVSLQLVGEQERLASLKPREESSIWKRVWSQSNQSWPKFASTFVLSWVFKLTSHPLCLMENRPGTWWCTTGIILRGESDGQVYPVQPSRAQWIIPGSNLQLGLNGGESSSITIRRSLQSHSYFKHQAHATGRSVTARQWL